MPRLRMIASVSLDGFMAGPDQSVDAPLGVGGQQLHAWAFAQRTFRATHGMEGGIDNESTPFVTAFKDGIGASIMGRNMFGGGPGAWPSDPTWDGWWGSEPPYHHPVFVLTHHAREPLVLGDTTFTFVTDGIESALTQAQAAAGDGDIVLAGGADVQRQYLAAGLVDELLLNVAPVLLGVGERPLDGVTMQLTPREVVAAPGVTHYRFDVG